MTVSLDANIFIYALNAHAKFGAAALALLKLVENGTVRGITSEMSFLEVLSGKDLSQADLEKSRRLLVRSNVLLVPVNTSVLEKAAELRRETNIKTADAIHIATAILHRADYFVTNDLRLPKLPFAAPEVVKITTMTDRLADTRKGL